MVTNKKMPLSQQHEMTGPAGRQFGGASLDASNGLNATGYCENRSDTVKTISRLFLLNIAPFRIVPRARYTLQGKSMLSLSGFSRLGHFTSGDCRPSRLAIRKKPGPLTENIT